MLVRETRAKKLVEISTEEVSQSSGRASPRRKRTPSRPARPERLSERLRLCRLGPSLEYAEDHVFERVSVAREP